MTDYISITEAQTDPGAPFTSDLAKQYRDNPIAIAEGAVGAPRIQVGAFPETTVGTTVKYESYDSVSTTSSTYTKVLSGKFLGRGALTIEFVRGASVSGSFVKIQKNDVDVYTNTDVPGTYTFDLAYNVGDRFSFLLRSTSSGNSASLNSVKLKTGGEDIFFLNGLMSNQDGIINGTWY